MKRGRPSTRNEPTGAVSTRLPTSIIKQLKTRAASEKRSIASLVRIIIEDNCVNLNKSP